MATQWLTLASRGEDVCLNESTAVSKGMSKLQHLVIDLGREVLSETVTYNDKHQSHAGIWLEEIDSTTAIARHRSLGDISTTTSGYLISHQLHGPRGGFQEIVYRLYGSALFPLSSIILLRTARFCGLKPSAEALAKCLRYRSVLEIPWRPILVLISTDVRDIKDFQRLVTTELLCTLRQHHPDMAFSFKQVMKMWSHRISLHILSDEANIKPHLLSLLGLLSRDRMSNNTTFSANQFHTSIRQAFQSMAGQADTVAVPLSIDLTLPDADHINKVLKRFLQSEAGADRISIVASCLAFRLSSQGLPGKLQFFTMLYNFLREIAYRPGLVFAALTRQVLQGFGRGTLAELEQAFYLAMEGPFAGSCIQRHLTYMRYADLSLPGCCACLCGISIHRLTCSHRFCNPCLWVIVKRSENFPTSDHRMDCPLCGKPNEEVFRLMPQVAGTRVLVLYGTVNENIRFLAKVRETLFGHLEDYFDLVLGSESAASLVLDYFCRGLSLPECARRLKRSTKERYTTCRTDAMPTSRVPISLIHGNQILSGHSSWRVFDDKRRWLSSTPWLPRFLASHQTAAKHQAEKECRIMFHQSPWLKIEPQSEQWTTMEVSSKLVASLFYIELLRQPSPNCKCHLEIRCRLRPGVHLCTVLRQLAHRQTQLYWKASGNWANEALCSLGLWRELVASNGEYVKQITAEVVSLNTLLYVRVDGLNGGQENISHSPYRLGDLINDTISSI